MRIGVVVDSTCDLPGEFIEQNKIVLLPISIRVGEELIVDTRDPAKTKDLYDRHLDGKNKDYAESVPFSPEQIEHLFLSRLVLEFDYVFCVCVHKERSPIFDNATQASYNILTKYREIRDKAGIEGPFRMRVMNSQNFFSAQGVQILELVRLIKTGATSAQILQYMEQAIPLTYGYMVPSDLYYIYTRAQRKGEKSVGWASYAIGSALNIKPVLRCVQGDTGPVAKLRGFESAAERLFEVIVREIERGLLAPYVMLSYGGDLDYVPTLPGFGDLMAAAKARGVEVMLSHMGMVGGVNVGRGALSCGIIAQPHEFNG